MPSIGEGCVRQFNVSNSLEIFWKHQSFCINYRIPSILLVFKIMNVFSVLAIVFKFIMDAKLAGLY